MQVSDTILNFATVERRQPQTTYYQMSVLINFKNRHRTDECINKTWYSHTMKRNETTDTCYNIDEPQVLYAE